MDEKLSKDELDKKIKEYMEKEKRLIDNYNISNKCRRIQKEFEDTNPFLRGSIIIKYKDVPCWENQNGRLGCKPIPNKENEQNELIALYKLFANDVGIKIILIYTLEDLN